nr:MAG: NADH-quinone oxidoreductase subunit NuoE [Hyphomicrobiales bacterium]
MATLLSADAIAKIDKEIAKYPVEHKASAVMSSLAIAQQERGWLSEDVIECVAAYLDMPPIAVWEVATFYGMYNLEKPGRFKIAICTNLPCALRGANDAADHLKRKLQIDFNQTTADGLFTLKEVECMGACGDAPVCIVNDRKMMSFMTPESLDNMLEELKNR